MTNKVRSYSISRTDLMGVPYVSKTFYSDSNSTMGPSGKPDRRAQNPYMLVDITNTSIQRTPVMGPYGANAWRTFDASEDSILYPGYSWNSQENEARAKFLGKVRKGSASLGVTLASWKQSRDMIVNRTNSATKSLDRSYNALLRDPKRAARLRQEKEPLANQVLETQFGWMPLISDVKAALTTVCQEGVPPEWVSSSANRTIKHSTVSGEDPILRDTYTGTTRCRVVANVQIENPNLWLLNRMGLINPGTVIWDLIPWSFVVNMFVNVNQMVSSVTDTVGLNLTNISMTKSGFIVHEQSIRSLPSDLYPQGYPGPARGENVCKSKERTVGNLPSVHWDVHVPKLDWNLAVIATSLLLQKAQRLNNLIRVF